MAKSKRKRRLERRDKVASKKIFLIIAVSTVLFMFLLYLLFRSS